MQWRAIARCALARTGPGRVHAIVPMRPITPRAGRIFRFPAQNLVSVSKYRLAPIIHSWNPPFSNFTFLILFGFCRGDAVAKKGEQ
jgi:hypothetical protein